MKPRYVFASLMLLAEAPILAVLVVAWLISGAVYAVVRGVAIVRSRAHAGSNRRRRIRRSAAADRAGAEPGVAQA